MFGHLDDPSPPQPTARAIAAIFARSAARRRRRNALLFGGLGVAILALGMVIGFLVPRGPTSIQASNLAEHLNDLSSGLLVPAVDLTGVVFPDDRHGFALTAGAGKTALVESVDGGSTWEVVTGHLPVGSSAQLDFANPHNGYLWGGPPRADGSLPLWVTDNGGQSWARAPIGPVVSDVSAIGTDVWAVVGTCTLTSSVDAPACPVAVEESSNAGITWAESTTSPPLQESSAPSFSDQDIELARMSRMHAYVLTFDPFGQNPDLSGLVYTGDGGATWSVRADPCSNQGFDYSEIAGSGTDDLWLLCSGLASPGEQTKALFRSFDGGATWALVSSAGDGGPPAEDQLPLAGLVAPFSLGHDNLAVISASDAWLFPARGRVYDTTDGGRTWTLVPGLRSMSSIGATGSVVFADATHGWVDAAGVGIWRTTNAANWHELGS